MGLLLSYYVNRGRGKPMHKVRLCFRCNTDAERACNCTAAQIDEYADNALKELERQNSMGNWALSQMAKHLRDNGYKVEKRKPNPKKRKLKRRK